MRPDPNGCERCGRAECARLAWERGGSDAAIRCYPRNPARVSELSERAHAECKPLGWRRLYFDAVAVSEPAAVKEIDGNLVRVMFDGQPGPRDFWTDEWPGAKVGDKVIVSVRAIGDGE